MFEVGDRVKIIWPMSAYCNEVGTVRRIDKDRADSFYVQTPHMLRSNWLVGEDNCGVWYLPSHINLVSSAPSPRLHKAVKNLYYAARWSADRPCDEQGLWTELRDAAGFEPGSSPKPFVSTFEIGDWVTVKPSTNKGMLWSGMTGEIIAILPEQTRTLKVDFKGQKGRKDLVRYRHSDLSLYLSQAEFQQTYDIWDPNTEDIWHKRVGLLPRWMIDYIRKLKSDRNVESPQPFAIDMNEYQLYGNYEPIIFPCESETAEDYPNNQTAKERVPKIGDLVQINGEYLSGRIIGIISCLFSDDDEECYRIFIESIGTTMRYHKGEFTLVR